MDSIRADEALKGRTRQFVHAALERRRGARARVLRRVAAACACLALLVIGGRLYFRPASVISVDINPSLELTVNRFGRVTAVSPRNEDGQQLADELALLHQDYRQAVDKVLSSETVQACLAGEELLYLTVVEIDPDQGQAILQYLSERTAGQPNTLCCGVGAKEVEQAHSLGLSYGKYRIYQQILARTDRYTAAEIGSMTMRQLRDLLLELGAEDVPGGNGHGGQGAGHGWAGGRGAA